MTVTAENLGGGGSVFPPKGTQLAVMIDNFTEPLNPNGKINSSWRVDFIGSDSLNMGVPVTINNQFNAITFTPVGQNPPSAGLFQSGSILTPLPLAWYTQIRATQMSVITIVNENFTQSGLCALSAICCLSGGMQSGQCYTLTAATYGDPPRHDLVLQVQKWNLPNIPNIGTAQPPNTRWVPTNLLSCGFIHSGDRIIFQAIDQGSSWRLIAAMIPDFLSGNPGPMEIRGVITDSSIGAGQPALGGITFAGVEPFSMRDFVGGFGPNDRPLA